MNEQKTSYYHRNQERVLARMKAYNEANKNKRSEQQKKWRKANKDKLSDYMRSYAERNKHKDAHIRAWRRHVLSIASKDAAIKRSNERKEKRLKKEALKQAKLERMKKRGIVDGRRFFYYRAAECKRSTLKKTGKATDCCTEDLAKVIMLQWVNQRGRCAYTGRKLNRSAHLDHINPRSKGGKDVAGNLQWLCPEANVSKSDMNEQEFIKMCAEVVMHKGMAYPGLGILFELMLEGRHSFSEKA